MCKLWRELMSIKKINKTVKIDVIEALKDILPQVFEDNKVNLNKLKSLLNGETVDKEDDRFYFNWAGKSNLFKLIQAPAYGTLKLDKKNSVEFDKTENLMIVGENLEALKLLLKAYFGRIKMIYIDPPYNTGKDFIYKDNFKEPLKDYLEKTGQTGSEGEKLTTNTETSGRYHSDWLNFMYSRLFIARSLLREDGVIFVSIDDNEVHHLRMIMDEIFGEENFVTEIVIQSNKRGQTYKQVAKTHEYLLVYSKTEETEVSELDKGRENDLIYADDIGQFDIRELRNRNPKFGRHNRPNLFYEFYVNPNLKDKDGFSPISLKRDNIYTVKVLPLNSAGNESCWRWGKVLSSKNISENTLKSNLVAKEKREGGFNIYEKYRKTTYKTKSIWTDVEVISEQGTIELGKIGLSKYFDFPKPLGLITKIIQIGSGPDDIILDFFAGSGTTGQAVFDLNKNDGGHRRFILIQLDEHVNEKIEDGKAPLSLGLKTIADICIERLKRVSNQYKENKTLFSQNQDFGFKVLRLDKSNFNLKDEFEITKEEETKELKKKYLEWLGMWIKEPLVPGWKPLDVVYEVILKEGFDLNSAIKEIKIKTNEFWHVTDEKQEQEFYISLDDKISKATIEEIRTSKYKNKTFVFLDKALTDNDKLNLKAFVRIKVI